MGKIGKMQWFEKLFKNVIFFFLLMSIIAPIYEYFADGKLSTEIIWFSITSFVLSVLLIYILFLKPRGGR